MVRNSKNIPVSFKERVWLDSRGGRTMEDVEYDEQGKYVFDGNMKKMYIPKGISTKRITKNFRKDTLDGLNLFLG